MRRDSWERVQRLNKSYEQLADADPLVHYVDVATPLLNEDGTMQGKLYVSDGLHLSGPGNEIWGATIKAALMPMEAAYE